MSDTIVDDHDLDGSDEIYDELFDHTQDLRTCGVTPKEIVPRLRKLADAYEDHFQDSTSWDQAPVDKEVPLPGDHEDE